MKTRSEDEKISCMSLHEPLLEEMEKTMVCVCVCKGGEVWKVRHRKGCQGCCVEGEHHVVIQCAQSGDEEESSFHDNKGCFENFKKQISLRNMKRI